MSYYVIKSKLSGLVLDVKKESRDPGASVIMFTEKNQDNQLWYDHLQTGTIRSKMTDFCLDLDADLLVVRPYERESHTQQWVRSGEYIRSRNNSNKVLDIYGGKKSTGAKVGVYDFHGKENQQWEFIPAGPVPSAPATPSAPTPATPSGPVPTTPSTPSAGPGAGIYPSLRGDEHGQRREFWIVNEMNQKVVDIQSASMAADAKVILWEKNGSPLVKNQLWFQDDEGYVRSCLNNYVFQTEENGKLLRMTPYRKNPRGQWMVEGKKIINRTGECLEVNGSELNCGHYKGSSAQHWTLQYT